MDPDLLFGAEEAALVVGSSGVQRWLVSSPPGWTHTIDVHLSTGIRFGFLERRSGGTVAGPARDRAVEIRVVHLPGAGGCLLRFRAGRGPVTLWLPDVLPRDGHSEGETLSDSWSSGGAREGSKDLVWEFLDGIEVTSPGTGRSGPGETTAYVAVEDPEGSWFEQIARMDAGWFQPVGKVDWFRAESPASFWHHFAGGSVFDPREGPRGRFVCQQCALAWWDYFRSLALRTGDGFWSVVQREIAFSAFADLGGDGRWLHGLWRDPPETHSRFQADGILLLVAEGAQQGGGDEALLEGARRAARWVFHDLTDALDGGGLWFLHDTLELGSSLGHRPLGASPGNTFCLNTHLRMLLAFLELSRAIPPEPWLEDAVSSASLALESVLGLAGGRWLRSLLSRAVTSIVAKNPLPNRWARLRRAGKVRVTRRLAFAVRRLYPAILHPDGYLERDLDRSFAGAGYHVITLKDLLMLYGRKPLLTLREPIVKALEWTSRLELEQKVHIEPMAAEFLDTLLLYGRLIAPVEQDRKEACRRAILEHYGVLPLDTALIDLNRYPGIAALLPREL